MALKYISFILQKISNDPETDIMIKLFLGLLIGLIIGTAIAQFLVQIIW